MQRRSRRDSSTTKKATFRLVRMDDNGVIYVMFRDLEQRHAERLMLEYSGKGHKQTYWVERE